MSCALQLSIVKSGLFLLGAQQSVSHGKQVTHLVRLTLNLHFLLSIGKFSSSDLICSSLTACACPTTTSGSTNK